MIFTLVCTREEQEVLNRGSKKSDQLMKKLMSDEAKIKAEKLKNTLLEYDKTSEKRTKVIDDESDYFAVDNDKWLTKDQRKKLKEREKEIWEQRHGSRLNKKYNFDFAGRKIVEDNVDFTNYDPSQDEKIKAIMNSKSDALKDQLMKTLTMTTDNSSFVANPSVQRPLFIGNNNFHNLLRLGDSRIRRDS